MVASFGAALRTVRFAYPFVKMCCSIALKVRIHCWKWKRSCLDLDVLVVLVPAVGQIPVVGQGAVGFVKYFERFVAGFAVGLENVVAGPGLPVGNVAAYS